MASPSFADRDLESTARIPALWRFNVSKRDGDLLQLRLEGDVGVLTFNNPQRLNALNWAMRSALYERLSELEANDACRAVVLTGAGGNFCAGGDISEMERRPVAAGRVRADLAVRIFRKLIAGPKPVICAVEGHAAGAGVSFVAASDYAVAASDARFSCAFIKVGLIPDFGALWSLPRRLGRRRAMELCALGETFDAAAALQMQLINRVCAPGEALAAGLEIAHRFAQAPALAMAFLRAGLSGGSDTVEGACTTEVDLQSVLQNTDEFEEAVRAFRDKRRPRSAGP
jgi:enoyl-CoA hydratase/carnithine racemase